MSDIPKAWALSNIGIVCTYLQRGRSPKYCDHSALPVINQRSIRWHGIDSQYLKYVHPDQFPQWSNERYVRAGDVLWNSTGTGTLGRACLIKDADVATPKVVDSHVTILRPNPQVVDSRFLFYWIKGPTIQNMIDALSSGTTNQIELNRSTISETRIPIPPLNEQKRIADKLDVLLEAIAACRKRIHLVQQRFPDQFRNAVLCHAFKGNLSQSGSDQFDCPSQEEIAKSRAMIQPNVKQDIYPPLTESELKPLMELPSGWRWEKAGNIAQSIVPNRDKPKSFSGNIPWVTTPQLSDSAIEIRYNSPSAGLSTDEIATYNCRVVPSQSVIMTCVGSLGITAITVEPCVINQQLHAFVTHDLINPKYFAYALKYQKVWLEQNATSTTVRYLNKNNCNSVPIPLCSKAEQEIIANRVEHLFAMCTRIESALETLDLRLNKITDVILRAAFRGELVAQDPNDESAIDLLARIHRAPADPMIPRRAKVPKKEKTLVT